MSDVVWSDSMRTVLRTVPAELRRINVWDPTGRFDTVSGVIPRRVPSI